MIEEIYKGTGWTPNIIRKDGSLFLNFGAGADANHEPRTFNVPITQAHSNVIQTNFTRHILLWTALLPLCDAAGTEKPLDESVAVALLDPILFGPEDEVEALFKTIPFYKGHLIARHANISLLEEGKLFAALENSTEQEDSSLAQEYNANQERARRGVVLTPLDAAILKFTNRFLYQSGLAFRKPNDVDPELLDEVMKVVAIAEQSVEGVEFTASDDEFAARKLEWKLMQERIENAVHEHFPTLTGDARESVAVLLCSEASKRAREKNA